MITLFALVGILAAGGIHLGWVDVPPAERVAAIGELNVGEIVHINDVEGRSVWGRIVDASGTTLTIQHKRGVVAVAGERVQTGGVEIRS